jgi:hypothetical protein
VSPTNASTSCTFDSAKHPRTKLGPLERSSVSLGPIRQRMAIFIILFFENSPFDTALHRYRMELGRPLASLRMH